MAKGFFTQGMCLLTDGQPTLDDIKGALLNQKFEIAKEVPANENWCLSGASVVVPFRPEVNGYVSVDLVNQLWPDTMGDPKSDPMLFGAWAMGHFGPYAFPGSLMRARQHAWAWEQGRKAPDLHRGFIRLRTSYVFGTPDDAPVLPKDCDPVAELNFLNRATLALLSLPGVICYFNPNGEVLRDRAGFGRVFDECTKRQLIPLPLWANVRFFKLNEKYALMDTVGNWQLDIQDVEAIFPTSQYKPGDVDYYMRNVTQYLLGLKREMKSGEAIDGPGETNLSWITESLDKGVVQPPRHILRLYPKANRSEIQSAIASMGRGSA
jgi:hypothetical protein